MHKKKQSAEVSTLIHALILLAAAVIWGFAFVSQSIGADYVGPFTFLAGRCWIAVAFLIPVVAIADRVRERGQAEDRIESSDKRAEGREKTGIAAAQNLKLRRQESQAETARIRRLPRALCPQADRSRPHSAACFLRLVLCAASFFLPRAPRSRSASG